ncbi:replication-relaxation family protein [Nocardia asteroides]|uniref:replication-relaxation family protein n=1 Tax=Nocardia asteroides TaxID=1824 RepID=UPI0037C993BC
MHRFNLVGSAPGVIPRHAARSDGLLQACRSPPARCRPLRQRSSAPNHWTLAPTGAAILAAEAGVRAREIGYHHQHTLAIAHSLYLNHTVAVNGWYTALIIGPRSRDTGDAPVVGRALQAALG